MVSPIALLTDFGLNDPYVGQMKGAIANHGPGVPVIDLCHQVEPCNILQAGFFLHASHEHFPDGTIFICVVDPGVGTARRIIVVTAGHKTYMAPDNGLLGQLLDEAPWANAYEADLTPFRSCSATFHGRDIFAPLAARLALGAAAASIGRPIELDTVHRISSARPVFEASAIVARVQHVDRFGNCLLNLGIADWQAHAALDACLFLDGGIALSRAKSYGDLFPGEIGILAGSQGVLELTMNQSNAAARLKLAPGSPVRITTGIRDKA